MKKLNSYVFAGAVLVGLGSILLGRECRSLKEITLTETQTLEGVVQNELGKNRMYDSETSYRLVNEYEILTNEGKRFFCFTENGKEPFDAGDRVSLKVRDGELTKDRMILKYGPINGYADGRFTETPVRRIISYEIHQQ